MMSIPSRDSNRQSQDFGACDLEPIHVPGSIQPHGLLIAIDPATDLIVQAAGDAGALLARRDLASGDSLLGLTMRNVLGVSLDELVQETTATLLRDPIYLGAVGPFGDLAALAVTAHQTQGVAIVEAQLGVPTASAASAATTLANIRFITERVGGAHDLLEACVLATREIHRITGYDRVMVYQFLPDGSGSVIAEQRGEHVSPYLNHRFPAADIPQQARELYKRSTIRIIPDVAYVPVPLVPALSPATLQPLDMSSCILRSVSPVHVRYLKNMGVGASMSVSLLSRDKLWGLIACHNTAPRIVPYEAQEACRHVGQILSQKIVAHQEAESHRVRHDLDVAQQDVLGQLARSADPDSAILTLPSAIQSMVPSSGAAIIWKDAVTTSGRGPSEPQIRNLAAWLKGRNLGADYFATDRLSQEYPDAQAFASEASGLLSIILPGDDSTILIWFRSEEVEEINWAGNPYEQLELGPSLGLLNPRKSFDLWQETVRERSRPWNLVEIESVREFGPRAAFILQQKRIRELNQILADANEKLAALASTDGLTGIANRRAFNDRLLAEWARADRSRQSLSLIILDLDYFKQYNDHYGHLMGDECLKQVARVLQDRSRRADLVARIGGEEFSVLLADTDIEGAMLVAETARSHVEGLRLEHAKSPIGIVTASFGVAAATDLRTQTARDLMQAADKALYEAKASGRNRVVRI
jgi:chemotaxis family two-component system sensor kinase Cph1